MSCNCGCHDDKTPATGWRRFVPLVVGAVVIGVIVVGAVLKTDGGKASGTDAQRTPKSTASRP